MVNAVPTDAEIAAAVIGIPQSVGEPLKRERARELQYWRMFACGPECQNHLQQKGWISTGPVLTPYTAVEYTEFMESKHAQPLSKDYGTDIGPIEGVPNSGTMYNGPTRFKLLIERGGIKELPADQIVAYGWHRIRFVRAARPDIVAPPDIHCEYGCPNRVFTEESAYAKHVKAMHNESSGVRAVGKQFEATIGQLAAAQQLDPNALAIAIAQAVLQYEANKGVIVEQDAAQPDMQVISTLMSPENVQQPEDPNQDFGNPDDEDDEESNKDVLSEFDVEDNKEDEPDEEST